MSAVTEPVPSPCISVCRMDAASGLCEGCLRTLDEIAAWSRWATTRQARGLAADRASAVRRQPAWSDAMKQITFYLDFISPYAYLAFEKLPEALEGLSYSVALQAGAARRRCSSTTASWARPRSRPSATGPTARCCGWATRTASRSTCRPRIRSTRCRSCGWRWPPAHDGDINRYVGETIFRDVWQGGGDAGDAARLAALAAQLQPGARRRAATRSRPSCKRQHRRGHRARRVRRADAGGRRPACSGASTACPMLRDYLDGDAWFAGPDGTAPARAFAQAK